MLELTLEDFKIITLVRGKIKLTDLLQRTGKLKWTNAGHLDRGH